uniref:Uncharacterized protein n=1 Tax=Arundo donax TaxID=35708 RepID=A0A0A9FN21_ARUDO
MDMKLGPQYQPGTLTASM